MDFSGWEKLSLVDFDGRVATTLFTAGCPFRCPFCHNKALVIHPELAPTIPWEEIVSYLKKRQGMLEGVAITGGEPTLMNDLEQKIAEIKSLGYLVKLDSNGCHPKILKKLIDAKLIDYVAMDIKNCPERYGETIGLPNYDLTPIKESIEILMTSGIDYEFRTTVVKEFHDDASMEKLVSWIAGAKRYFLQRFVASEHCIEEGLHPIQKEDAERFLEIAKKKIPQAALRDYDIG